MSSIDKKLEQLGYGHTTKAIMIPLATLRTWSDEEILELNNTNVNLIITPKIEKYLKDRYLGLGMKHREIQELFADEY